LFRESYFMTTGKGFARTRRNDEKKTEEPVMAHERKEEEKKTQPRAEGESPPKGPPPVALVNTRHHGGMIERAARGFSPGELSASRLSFEKAKRWRVPLDPRRRSVLDGNVERLKNWHQMAKPPKREKPPEVVKPQEKRKKTRKTATRKPKKKPTAGS